MAKIALINGPNLNLLGERDPAHYGKTTLAEIVKHLKSHFDAHEIRDVQSNHEGAIIDAIHDARQWADGIVLNAGAFTHTSHAIGDAVSSIKIPVVEVHLSNIHGREEFRRRSCVVNYCIGQISGFGAFSYELGMLAILNKLSTK